MEIGCSGETSIDHRVVSGQTNPNFMSLDTGILTLVYPKVTSAMSLSTVSLNGTVEWFSDI